MRQKLFSIRGNRVHRMIIISLILILGLTGNSIAQQYKPGQGQNPQGQQQQYMPPEQPQSAEPDFSDEEIEKAAEAYVNIIEIRNEYQEKLAKVEDSDKAKEIQSEANEEITSVIKNKGLNLTRYNEIISSAQTNDQTRTELMKKLDKVMK
jgi:hypothetical protein